MAAPVYEGSARGFGTGGGTSRSTASFAIGNANRCAWAFVAVGAGTPVFASTVKWNTTESFTQTGTQITIAPFGKFEVWRLINPTATTSTVDVTWPSSVDEQLVIGIGFSTVDQVTPNGTIGSNTGTGTAPTITLTTVSGDVTVGGMFDLDSIGASLTITAGGGQTSRQEIEGANTAAECLGVGTLTASGTSTALPWTISASPNEGWAMLAFTVNGALLGPTIDTQPVSTTADIGGTATFTIAATTSGGALSYQWKFNGSNVGSNSATYSRSGVVSTDQRGAITCDVTDSNGTVTSATATLTLNTSSVYLWDTSVQSGNDVWLRDPTEFTSASGSTGTVAYTNVNDASAASGTTTLVGTFAKTNNNDTSAASGTTTILGTLAKTNANDTSAANGTTTVTGTVAKTNNNDSVVASGSVGAAVSGTLATTNANDTLAASGTTTILGTLTKTNANDTSAASGTTTVTGTVATTNANDSVVASGQAGAITGTVSYTNNDDGVSANGIVGVPNTIPIGGAGHPSGIYWGVRKHKKFTKNLEWLMDTVVSEYYEEMTEKANPAIQKEAAKIIRPFAQDGLKIPELVNWDAMQQDLDRVIQLLELYQNYRNIEEEDELWMMMH